MTKQMCKNFLLTSHSWMSSKKTVVLDKRNGKREKEESELNQESGWELMISYRRTRKMKNQHLQNGKQERKGKFQEKSMKMKMTMCGFVMSARKYGMTMTKTVGFCVIYVMQSSICSALDFAMKSMNIGI